jgi:uncharacterized membrane protein
MFVLTFPGDVTNASGKIDQTIKQTPVLANARQEGNLRLIDLLLVRKDASGKIDRVRETDLTPQQRTFAGALAGGLVGLGAGAQMGQQTGQQGTAMRGAQTGAVQGARFASKEFGLDDQQITQVMRDIPPNTLVAIVIVEHVWATQLSKAIKDAGGMLVAEGMVTPEALVGLGAALASVEQSMNQNMNQAGRA